MRIPRSATSNRLQQLVSGSLVLLLIAVLFSASCPVRKSLEVLATGTEIPVKKPKGFAMALSVAEPQECVCLFKAKLKKGYVQVKRAAASDHSDLLGFARPSGWLAAQALTDTPSSADVSKAVQPGSAIPLYLRNRLLLI